MGGRAAVSDARVLLERLLAAAPDETAEACGATALFSEITGTEITAVMHSRRACRLTARQQGHLRAAGTAGHERRGVLYAGAGVAVAATTAVLVPARVPDRVRAMLGVGPDGAVLPAEADMPLGRALAGFGVRRELLGARLTLGRADGAGSDVVIVSAARLWLGSVPVAVVTEHVLAAFVAAFPGPWDRP
jgi:hypothetical protein